MKKYYALLALSLMAISNIQTTDDKKPAWWNLPGRTTQWTGKNLAHGAHRYANENGISPIETQKNMQQSLRRATQVGALGASTIACTNAARTLPVRYRAPATITIAGVGSIATCYTAFNPSDDK